MFDPHDHLLFIGDSITHAHRRPEEFHDCFQLGCGFVNHLAGALHLRHPEFNLRFTNRGECGRGLPELAERWEKDCLALQPQVISILTGINDANPKRISKGLGLGPLAFREAYARLLERTRSSLPQTRIVLIEPFFLPIPSTIASPVPVISAQWQANARTLQPLIAPLAEQFEATFVPLQAAFDQLAQHVPPQHLALDGIHPSVFGHALIAQQWLKHVMNLSHPLTELAGLAGD